MSELASLDVRLFLLINRTWTHPVLDALMRAVTDFHNWRVPLVLVLLVVLARARRDGRIAVLIAVLAVGLTDQLVANGLKPIFHRVRPFEAIEGTRKLVSAHDASFPSAHAANTFAAGVFLALRFRRLRWILFVPAIVAYSRVYCGVHYPSDVLAGAALGAAVGAALFLLERTARFRFQRPGAGKSNAPAGSGV